VDTATVGVMLMLGGDGTGGGTDGRVLLRITFGRNEIIILDMHDKEQVRNMR